MNTVRKLTRRFAGFCFMTSTALLLAHGTVLADDGALDAAITAGFGKLIKYGRYGAALILAIVFCLAWAEKGQNSENPHQVTQSSRKRASWPACPSPTTRSRRAGTC